MSNQGVRGYYQLTSTIEEQLLSDVNNNTVSIGDISKLNLNKQDIFPMCHLIINSVTDEEQVLRFNISVLAMDMIAPKYGNHTLETFFNEVKSNNSKRIK